MKAVLVIISIVALSVTSFAGQHGNHHACPAANLTAEQKTEIHNLFSSHHTAGQELLEAVHISHARYKSILTRTQFSHREANIAADNFSNAKADMMSFKLKMMNHIVYQIGRDDQRAGLIKCIAKRIHHKNKHNKGHHNKK